MSKRTTVSAVSCIATALAQARGADIVITLEDVHAHMEWLKNTTAPCPITKEQAKHISAALNFLLSENVPMA